MATSNFHNENAPYILAVSDDEYEFFEDEMKRALKKFNNKNGWEYTPNEERLYETLRSYPAKSLGALYNSEWVTVGKDENGDPQEVEVTVTLKPKLVAGYYNGANVDWEIVAEADGYEFEPDSASASTIAEWYDTDRKKGQEIIDTAEKLIEAGGKMIVKAYEDAMGGKGIKLRPSARFSNGET